MVDIIERYAVMLAPGDYSGRDNAPTILHTSEADARREAERLCGRTGKRFVVLRAIAWVGPATPPMAWTEGAPDDGASELPF